MTPQTGTLFVVATPIGNLGDLTPRAAETLARVGVIYAEDTRRSRTLLEHLGLHTPLVSLHEHNERGRSDDVLARLAKGTDVALVTDAGTPAVSDPGSLVVEAALQAGLRVCPIPGASALAAALSVSGFDAGDAGILFVGFPPARGSERAQALQRMAKHSGVVVFLESPHRIGATLAELAAEQPEREACVGRELTKLYEEILRRPLAELARWAAGEVLGELTVVMGPSPQKTVAAPDDEAVDAALQRCLDAGLSTRDAATAVAAVLELQKRAVYQRAVKLG